MSHWRHMMVDVAVFWIGCKQPAFFISFCQVIQNLASSKGQLNSEWIYDVIISHKMQTKNYKNVCPIVQTKIVALFLVIFLWV